MTRCANFHFQIGPFSTFVKLQVLFVCLGNICRSPLAEGTFRELVAQKGLSDTISCDSAGTHGYHIGTLPDRRSRRVAADIMALPSPITPENFQATILPTLTTSSPWMNLT